MYQYVADARIGHDDLGSPIRRLIADAHHTARRRILDRVVQQIEKELSQAVLVPLDDARP
jgi:hypothetical protein